MPQVQCVTGKESLSGGRGGTTTPPVSRKGLCPHPILPPVFRELCSVKTDEITGNSFLREGKKNKKKAHRKKAQLGRYNCRHVKMSLWVDLGWSLQLPAGGGLDARLTSEIWKQTEWGLCNRLTGRLICTVAYSQQTEVNASDWGQQRWILFIFSLCLVGMYLWRTVLPALHWMKCVSPLIYSTRRVLSVCLLARGINTIIAGQTHLVISQMLMDSLAFSAFSHSSSVSLRSPLNIINLSPTPPHPLYGNDITISFNFSPISPSALAELLELQETGHISSSVAKQVGQLQTTRNYPLLFDTGSATNGSARARHTPLPWLNIPGFTTLSGFPGDVEVVGKDSPADHPGAGFRPR